MHDRSPVLGAPHEVVLPSHGIYEEGLAKQRSSGHNDCSNEQYGGVCLACQDAPKVQDHQEERQRGQIKFQELRVGDPLPLVRVDLHDRGKPACVIEHLQNVANAQSMSQGNAAKSDGKPRSKSVLHNVADLAAPMVLVEVHTAGQEDHGSHRVKWLCQGQGQNRVRTIAEEVHETDKSIESPANLGVEDHLIVLVQLSYIIQTGCIQPTKGGSN